MAPVFARKEHHSAILREEAGDFFGPIIVDIIAIGHLQAADGVQILKFADTVFERGKARCDFSHGSPRPARVGNFIVCLANKTWHPWREESA